MSGELRLVRTLVACYPPGWRRRYGDEYTQLLYDLRVHRRPALILDSLLGAVRAHGGVLMSSRSPMTVVVWATGLFTVAGIGFAKLSEDFTGHAAGMHALVAAAAAVALLAVAAGAAPAALALLRGHDNGAWKYVAVPVAGAAIWYGVLRLVMTVFGGHSVHSGPNVTGFLLIAVTGIALVAATAWAAAAVLRQVPVTPSPRMRSVATSVVTAGMGVATVASVLWGLQVRSQDRPGFQGDQGILATPFVPSWIAVVVALAAATALAASAGRREPAAARR
jgi:hypothetical protein